MHKVILLRHGESEWNRENLFTGWMDVDLNDFGRMQSSKAGKLIRKSGIIVDVAFTSYLKRAIHTLWLTLEELNRDWIPEYKAWQLNERHYGALQGLSKSEMAKESGEEQVKIWRRSYEVQPPALTPEDRRSPIHDPLYAAVDPQDLPLTESLEDTYKRVVPYWEQEIVPYLSLGKTVLISGHGNTFRALVKHLDDLSNEAVMELNLPIGEPIVYELDENMRPLRHYYLNTPEEIARGIKQQIDMGKAFLQEVG